MTDPALYKKLRDAETVDLVVYGSRMRCFCQDVALIEDGRPYLLRSIPISTWSLLACSVKHYRNGVMNYIRKFVLVPLILFYVLFLLPFFFPDDIYWIVLACLLPAFVIWLFVVHRLVRKFLTDEFHPAVKRVVEELGPDISDCGFEVEYIVQNERSLRSILRFIPKEESP